MTGNSYTSLVLPSTILKYFVTIIPLNKRVPYVSISTKERNSTILGDEVVNQSLNCMEGKGGREQDRGQNGSDSRYFYPAPRREANQLM